MAKKNKQQIIVDDKFPLIVVNDDGAWQIDDKIDEREVPDFVVRDDEGWRPVS
jgi:hypothetical protein